MSNILDDVTIEYEQDISQSRKKHSVITKKGGKIHASVKQGPTTKTQLSYEERANKINRRSKPRKAQSRKEISNIIWRVASMFVRKNKKETK